MDDWVTNEKRKAEYQDRFKDPRYYRHRAEEMRTLAMYLREPFAKLAMVKVADDYDAMAAIIEEVRS